MLRRKARIRSRHQKQTALAAHLHDPRVICRLASLSRCPEREAKGREKGERKLIEIEIEIERLQNENKRLAALESRLDSLLPSED
ncbi:MAG: hypothetical protein ACKO6F_11370 [Cyanobium sp.]